MIWDCILGHQAQIDMFRRAISRGRLAHGYLFIGPSGIGKRLFARTLVQCLFCERVPDTELNACGECASCRQMQAGHHPDLLTIGLPEGKRILPLSLLVGEDEKRGRSGLCYEISMSPMSAKRRVAIIDDAETMGEEAVNSLLKTLEEPPAGAILILLIPDADLTLPTIRSRCQPIQFSPLSPQQMTTILAAQSIDLQQAEPIIEMAGGSLNLVRKLLEPELRKLWQAVETQLHMPQVDALRAIRQVNACLEELGGDTATQRENLQWVIQFCIDSLRRKLATSSDFLELDRLGSMLDRCFEADRHLQQSMPVPLCLEAMFTEMGKRSRTVDGIVRT